MSGITVADSDSPVEVGTGIAHIKASTNNVMVTITDRRGDTLCWASAGTCGYKGARRTTFPAGAAAAQRAAERAQDRGVRAVEVRLKGEGRAIEGAVAGLKSSGLELVED